MTSEKKDGYPGIFLSATDANLPSWFTDDFRKYSKFQQMGGGGNGVLHAAYDGNLGRRVAIKRLAPSAANDEKERRRLLREARVTAQLQHPNTVPVYEIGKDDDGQIYFTMKKIEGENLFRILGRIAQDDMETLKAYPLDRLLGILIQACNALAYAHALGVIHRDVKPENIMVGLFGEVLLMDWGVAKVWGMPNEDGDDESGPRAAGYQRLTTTGQRPGTPLYMSPEQVLGNKHVDERTDIFSMGVVLYELLAQREPFRGPTIKDTFDNIVNETPPPPSQVTRSRTVPKRLDAICLKAMEKLPRDRYQSVQSMIYDIRGFRNDAMQANF